MDQKSFALRDTGIVYLTRYKRLDHYNPLIAAKKWLNMPIRWFYPKICLSALVLFCSDLMEILKFIFWFHILDLIWVLPTLVLLRSITIRYYLYFKQLSFHLPRYFASFSKHVDIITDSPTIVSNMQLQYCAGIPWPAGFYNTNNIWFVDN